MAKILGIYLMIIGHQNLVSDEWTSFIFTFHMPLFFVISGMFWRPISLKDTFMKNYRTLIIPFLIMTLIWCLYYFVCYVKGGIPLRQMVPYILGSFISPGKDFFFMHPYCIYLWFLIALAVIRLFCSLIHHKLIMIILSTILFIIDIFLSVKGIVLPFALDSAMLALPFFVIGFLTSSFLTKPHSMYWDIIILVISASLLLVFGPRNGFVSINDNLFGNNVLFYLLSGCCGTLMVFSISKMLSEFMLKPAIFGCLGKAMFGFVNVFAKGLLLVVGFSAMLSSFYRDVINVLIPSLNTNNNLFGLILGGGSFVLVLSLDYYLPEVFPCNIRI